MDKRHPYLIVGLLIILISCNGKKQVTDYMPVTMEMSDNDNAVDVFLYSNYYFLAKYTDPKYEPYGTKHWSSLDSVWTDGLLKIKRVSNCSEDSLNNEHFNFFGKCVLRQENIIDTVNNKTIKLILQTENETNKVDFDYDDLHRISQISDSSSNKTFQFVYSDTELVEIQEIDLVDGTNKIESIITFSRK
jgi:hypothetical protein